MRNAEESASSDADESDASPCASRDAHSSLRLEQKHQRADRPIAGLRLGRRALQPKRPRSAASRAPSIAHPAPLPAPARRQYRLATLPSPKKNYVQCSVCHATHQLIHVAEWWPLTRVCQVQPRQRKPSAPSSRLSRGLWSDCVRGRPVPWRWLVLFLELTTH